MKNLNIDKSKWKSVKFGEVVVELKETVSDLASSGLEHVVGLEHIDTESIHLHFELIGVGFQNLILDQHRKENIGFEAGDRTSDQLPRFC